MNSPSSLTIEVTAADIEAGRRKNCMLCPLALAVDRAAAVAFKGTGRAAKGWVDARIAVIYLDDITRRKPQVTVRYLLPDVAQGFIFAFDQGLSVKPFTFTMQLAA